MEFATFIPVVLAIAAAFFFATSSSLVRAGIRDTSPLMALLFSLSANIVILWVIVALLLDVQVDLWRWRYFIVAGTFAPVLGRFCNYTGIDKLGINISAPITYANPLVSVVLASLFLGERLSALGYLGGVSVIIGGALLGSVKADGGDGGIGGFESIERKHLVFPVLAALFYGTSHIFRELGISLVSSPILAAAVTTTTSWTWMMLYLGVTHRRHDFGATPREVGFFALAGTATSIAIPTLYAALRVGTVVVVTPIMNTSPFWVLVLSFIFFRDAEPFTKRVVGGTTLVVFGVVLLSTFGTV